MRLPFLRKSPDREPLIVAMTGARLGERILYHGESLAHVSALAGRSGLSGRMIVLAPAGETTAIEKAAARQGVLVEAVEAVPADAQSACDLAVLDASLSGQADGGWSGVLRTLTAALRPGGRLIAVEPARPKGLRARLAGRSGTDASALLPQMQAMGLTRARTVGERDGLRFVEAIKTGA